MLPVVTHRHFPSDSSNHKPTLETFEINELVQTRIQDPHTNIQNNLKAKVSFWKIHFWRNCHLNVKCYVFTHMSMSTSCSEERVQQKSPSPDIYKFLT